MAKIPRNIRFEDAMHKLESLVEQIESGAVGVEESIAKYEEAMALQAHCQRILDQAEQRIKKIQLDAAGGMTEATHEDDETEKGEDSGDSDPGND